MRFYCDFNSDFVVTRPLVFSLRVSGTLQNRQILQDLKVSELDFYLGLFFFFEFFSIFGSQKRLHKVRTIIIVGSVDGIPKNSGQVVRLSQPFVLICLV